MKSGVLTRINSSHKNLRTDEIEGLFQEIPVVGQRFRIAGEPLDKASSVRLVITSPVEEVRLHPEKGSLEFWTGNSHYGLQLQDMDTEGTA